MNTKSQSRTKIGFRLEPEAAEALAERANCLKVSPHDLARYYVVEALAASQHLTGMGIAMQALNRELNGLRADLALSVEALLASAGEVGEKQARAWVEGTLNRR